PPPADEGEPPPADAGEPPPADRTQEDLSAVYDETLAIRMPPAGDQAPAGDGPTDRTMSLEIDETQAIVLPAHDGPPTAAPDEAAAEEEPIEEEPVGAGEPVEDEPAPRLETGEPERPVPAAVDNAEPDNLRRIRGIGPAMERTLNAEGITTYRQLAVLSDAEIDALQARIPGLPGRIRRGRWVEQATELHAEVHGDRP
ncbi:MAG TPA: hypothetical protein VK875_10195, partial [Euzebyales bacterium]|nr:hypothetical protein [Euzebyales bacterium]